ncbi:unnamed protein product [Clonostachys rosea f. rosea IK726]|uniref:Uncharacterized protein n=1 Tax=Clonostachys rosea f. rosea IK726 TaxID=1349383 RepID=A0ACA9UFK8_BIOOC|nr:unnamed protein product [Clonostachys rosea f. rosea IK726]
MGMKAPIRTMNGDRMVPKSLLVRTTLRMEAGLRILLQSNAPHQTTTHAPLLLILFKRDRFMLRLCGTLPRPSLSKRTCNVINESNIALAGSTAYIRDTITSWLRKAYREGIILRAPSIPSDIRQVLTSRPPEELALYYPCSAIVNSA